MKLEKEQSETNCDGKEVFFYTVDNGSVSFTACNFGCTLTALKVPSKSGKIDDIVLGFSDFEGYKSGWDCFFGAVAGRFANRIGGASFYVDGKKYNLEPNDFGNTLHGGGIGYNRVVWDSDFIETEEGAGVCFTRISTAGEQGFPGELHLEITYLLNKQNELIMRYHAETDALTPINLTNHSYFNLKGEGNGTVLDHILQINADRILETDEKHIPTGRLLSVKETPFDFTSPKLIGTDFEKVPGGYDHCYCINGADSEKMIFCAEVFEPESGRKLIVETNQPGVQFYTGNYLSGITGKNGHQYFKQTGFCLETQNYPDAVNKPDFPNPFIYPGKNYDKKTVFKLIF